MSIVAVLRDNLGNELGRTTGGNSPLNALLPPFGDPDFPYLGMIDPYDDTIFNSTQMSAIRREIRLLLDLTPNPNEGLYELEALANECADRVHTFLVFIGD